MKPSEIAGYILQTISPWPGKSLAEVPRVELLCLHNLRKGRRIYKEHALEDMKMMEKYLIATTSGEPAE